MIKETHPSTATLEVCTWLQIAEKAAKLLTRASKKAINGTTNNDASMAAASGGVQLEKYSTDLRAEPVRKNLLRVAWGNKLVLEPALWPYRQQIVVHAMQVGHNLALHVF